MTSLLSTPDNYYGLNLKYYYQPPPPPPVTQTLSSVRFTDPTQHPDPEMYALRAMLSAHRTLPYAGRRASGNTKTNTLNNRLAYVEALVDTNALVIETMWCTNASPSTRQAAVVSLRTFIQEVLKRSRTTYSTLQTALFYLFRSQPAITAHLRHQAQHDKWEGTYINCGRRMFLASLVVASKFVQDKTYRNSAWAKIAGLPVAEINAAERIFLNLVNYQLYIGQPTFEQWHHLLHVHVESKTQQHP
ncbi:cyclin-domain-containing protein, partial [Chlamydoabsidia padenii]